jgi:uncharacterized protein
METSNNPETCSRGPVAARPRLPFTLLALFLGAWVLLYLQLESIARWITGTLLGASETPFASALGFFLYETPKVLMLLILVVYGVGILRTFFTQERTKKMLAGKKEFVGNVMAALLGVVTPFCSCSAVPLFIGFVTAGVPLGVTFSFLVSSPMINEVALVLLFGLFGWKVALLYTGTGLAVAITSGWVIGRLGMERHVEDWVYQSHLMDAPTDGAWSWGRRMAAGEEAVKDIVGKVWPWVLAGIAVGAFIHAWVPQDFLASIMGREAWWSVPLAVLIGIPLYSNAAGIVPIVQALIAKGAALGTALAFMMAVIGLSLPETIILRRVLKPRLIAVFLGVVAAGILMVGYLFNILL